MATAPKPISEVIPKRPFYPQSMEPIPDHMMRRAELAGEPRKGTPLMWVVPSGRLHCDKCSFRVMGNDMRHFKPGDPCPGTDWKNPRKITKRASLLDTQSTLPPRCKRRGIILVLYCSADLFKGNMSFNQMVNETRLAIEWIKGGKDQGNIVGKVCHAKWFTLEGAKNRLPIQLRGLVDVNSIHDTGDPGGERQTSFH